MYVRMFNTYNSSDRTGSLLSILTTLGKAAFKFKIPGLLGVSHCGNGGEVGC